MTHDEMISVIQAHKEGKTIEYIRKNLSNPVYEITENPCWNFTTYDYKVKPEDKYSPFTFDTNLVGKTIVNKNNKNRFLI